MPRLTVLAALITPALFLAGGPASAFGQAQMDGKTSAGLNAGGGMTAGAGVTPRDLAKTRSEFAKVRDRMESVQRDFDRAARANQPEVRDAALLDWNRALDGLEPYVSEMSADNADERPYVEQFQKWVELYNQAADPALAGKFFLETSAYWTQVTAGTEGWEQETKPTTFDAIAKAKSDDASVRAFGMPKTVAFVKAVDTYLANVRARPDFARFKRAPNVARDFSQCLTARSRAMNSLEVVARQITFNANAANLDQQGRDNLERFLEQDLPILAGDQNYAKLQYEASKPIYDFDQRTSGASAAAERSRGRLTAAADRDWPMIVTMYDSHTQAPVGATRGQIVRISGAVNMIGKQFGVDTYDFAGYIDGAPVVGNYVPALHTYLDGVFALTNMKKLPDDAKYDLVAVIRGTAQVPNVKRPGATTAPAAASDAAATTAPAVTDCTLLDIVALHAGPAAVGTPIVVTPQK